ncbi:MAG TPA: MMPL family transporter, partial [Acidimicrobiales bacterium]|nr:MMPL family transporter [Acidimicrobiales bacterium]
MASQVRGPAGRRPRRQRWLEAPSRLVVATPGRWLCLGAWVAVAAAALPFALRVGSAESNDLLSLLPANAPSTQVLRLDRLFPSGRHLQAVVVFRRAGGLTAADRDRISLVAARVARLRVPGLGRPSGLVASPDGKEELFLVPVAANQRDLVAAVGRLQALARLPGEPEAEVTGTAGLNADLFSAFSGVDLKLLVATAALVVLLLLLTYQSPFLWLVPLAAVALAVVVADAAVFGLSKVGLTLTGENVGLLTVVVFGAGTDYALLITARYREELRASTDRSHAMAVALSRATPSIVASGATVGAALLCLLAASFGVSRSFGVVGAVGVGAALATMLSAYPALLVACSRRVFWPRIPLAGTRDPSRFGPWAKVARALAARPRRLAALAAGALAVMSL